VAYSALEKMPADQRHAFVHRHVDGESVGEITAGMGRTPNAVSQLQFRACIAMRCRLLEMGYDEHALREVLRADVC
jgi:DNA-directed RNA polymerase specialized sigma24 family protein